MTLVYLAGAWLVGILLAQHVSGIWWGWLILAGIALLGTVLARKRKTLPVAFACLMLFALGAMRFTLSVPHFDEDDLATYNDQGYVVLDGLIIDAPDVRDSHVNLRIRAETLTWPDGQSQPVTGLVLVQAPRTGTYRYGDPVQVRGEPRTPPEFDTFSYRDYLAREGVYSIMNNVSVVVTGERRGSPIKAALLDFRTAAHETITALLPDPQASLLSGILLGIESGIRSDVREAFNAVSATHVIAISGSNLVILAGLIQSLAQRIVKKSSLVTVLTIAGVIFYAIFVGGDAAVLRAAVMTTLALVATQLGRQTYGLTSLAFAALLMTAINPQLLWDVGFQLSFLATLGLVLYVDPLQKGLEKLLKSLLPEDTARQVLAAVSDAFVVTLAAQITTTPIMAHTFERFSLISLPVNFLIIPAQTPLMVLGGVGVLLAMAFWPLGQVITWGSWLFLSWTWLVVRSFARFPFASVTINNLSSGLVWGIYIVMFGITFYAMQTEEHRKSQRDWLRQALGVKVLGGVGLLIATLLWAGAISLPDGRLHVTYIDVGEGTATLIETPGGRQILIDAGGSGHELSTGLGDTLPFWDRRIDLLVLTQPTEAHLAALPTILGRYRFDAVMTSGVSGTTQIAQSVESELEEQGIPQIVAQPGMRITVEDGVTLHVLYTQIGPPEDDSPGEPVVLMLEYGEGRFLFPGDLSEEAEAELVRSDVVLSATVLQVARSGHRAVTGDDFLAAVSPQISVISVDAGNRYDLPHAETLQRLADAGITLYRTDQSSSIHLISDGSRVWVRTAQ